MRDEDIVDRVEAMGVALLCFQLFTAGYVIAVLGVALSTLGETFWGVLLMAAGIVTIVFAKAKIGGGETAWWNATLGRVLDIRIDETVRDEWDRLKDGEEVSGE